jgi:hypothetical protein
LFQLQAGKLRAAATAVGLLLLLVLLLNRSSFSC